MVRATTDRVTTDKSVLKKAAGYWSKRQILINPTNKIVLLKEEATTKDAIEAIQTYIDSNILRWVTDSIKNVVRKYGKTKSLSLTEMSGFNISKVPLLQKPEWMGRADTAQETLSLSLMLDDLKKKGLSDEIIADELAVAWYGHYRVAPWSGLATQQIDVGLELLMTDWSSFHDVTLQEFINELYELMSIDIRPTRFDKSIKFGKSGSPDKKSWSDVGQLLREKLPEPEMKLMQRCAR